MVETGFMKIDPTVKIIDEVKRPKAYSVRDKTQSESKEHSMMQSPCSHKSSIQTAYFPSERMRTCLVFSMGLYDVMDTFSHMEEPRLPIFYNFQLI